MSTTSPAIDLLLPVYNGVRYLQPCLDSLLAQSFRDFRILAVDDGSSDATPELLQAYAARDPRVVVELAPHRGVGPTLNAALALATAPYIARQDHDDLSLPERFERQFGFLEAHPDHVAVSSRHRIIDGDGRVLGEGWFPPPVETADPYCVPAVEPHLPHTLFMVRREALVAIGGYRDFDHVQDVDLYWRLLPLGRMTTLPEILGDYRVHTQSISGSSVVQGRIQAVTAELSAVSARRRLEGRPDIAVPSGLTRLLTERQSLPAMLAFFAPGLTAAEQAYLAAASVVKLFEYASVRPYRLEDADLDLAARLFRRMPFAGDADRDAARKLLRSGIKRFFADRRWAKRAFLARHPRFALALEG